MRCSLRSLIDIVALSLLVVGAALTVATVTARGQQTCADPVPPVCETVRQLGEANGCACFICNPDTDLQQLVCTDSLDVQESLMARPQL